MVWEGNLKKKTPRGLVKVWQSRYFRLLGDVLEYYKSDKLGVCSGMIPLQMMTGLVVHPRAKKEGCRFDLIIEVGQTRKVFALLAPSASICEKLVRSMRNMLHHPVDESARMDIENIDLRGAFWKRIDEIDRRRAGSSKKVDVAAQFAGFDIKPRQRRKKPTMDSVAEGATDPATTSGSPPTTSRMERERMQVDAQVEEVETVRHAQNNARRAWACVHCLNLLSLACMSRSVLFPARHSHPEGARSASGRSAFPRA